MQLVLHTGAHYTEEERLMKCLLRNTEDFRERGIVVPGPSAFRGLMRDTLNAMGRQEPAENAREVLLDVMLDDAGAERIILSDPNFFRTQSTALRGGMLYPDSPQRMASMQQLFPDDELQICLAIRNPAALLPLFYREAVKQDDDYLWAGREPADVRWSETIQAIRAAVPDIPMTIWCNEDAPLIWADIMRELAGLAPEEKMQGGFDLLNAIMSKEGMTRFRSYIDAHPDMSEPQKRRVIAAFLDKFALEEEIEEELDMPGWTEETVEELTALYDADTAVIEQLPGVKFITP